MPIILYFSRPISDRVAVEQALQIRTSKRVVGAWFWDNQCNMAPVCLYFRPRRYWPPHTRVSFTTHLNGVEVAPGVYGHHTLTQTFTIGPSLIVVASTARHYMNVYREVSCSRTGRSVADGPGMTPRMGPT